MLIYLHTLLDYGTIYTPLQTIQNEHVPFTGRRFYFCFFFLFSIQTGKSTWVSYCPRKSTENRQFIRFECWTKYISTISSGWKLLHWTFLQSNYKFVWRLHKFWNFHIYRIIGNMVKDLRPIMVKWRIRFYLLFFLFIFFVRRKFSTRNGFLKREKKFLFKNEYVLPLKLAQETMIMRNLIAFTYNEDR